MLNYGVLILAAGQSSRMASSSPKALLKFSIAGQAKTALEILVDLYQKASIQNIYVVSGFHQEIIQAEAHRLGVEIIHNSKPEDGMFSSICAGLRALPTEISHCFIQPVDIPLVRFLTLQILKFNNFEFDDLVLIPKFLEEKGHPVLVPRIFFAKILAWSGQQGLQGALDSLNCREILVADQNIHLDMDKLEDYAKLQIQAEKYNSLNYAEALAALYSRQVPQKALDHALAVCQIATAFAQALLNRGFSLDLELVQSSALLHDICKGERNHEEAGSKLLAKMGYPKQAEIVALHRDCELEAGQILAERELVYLADKFVNCNRYVPIEERFEKKKSLYCYEFQASNAIEKRKQNALKVAKRLFELTGQDAHELAKTALANFENDFADA